LSEENLIISSYSSLPRSLIISGLRRNNSLGANDPDYGRDLVGLDPDDARDDSYMKR